MTPLQTLPPYDDLDRPLYGATFGQAVGRFFRKYTTFKGRASRSEYWWVQLFLALLTVVLVVLALVLTPPHVSARGDISPVSVVVLLALGAFWLAAVVPAIALVVRRLHDANFSGWLALLLLIPYLGGFVICVMALLSSDPRGSRFDAFPTIPTEPDLTW